MDVDRPFEIDGTMVTFNVHVDQWEEAMFIPKLAEALKASDGGLTFDFYKTKVVVARWMRALETFRLESNKQVRIEGVSDELMKTAEVIDCEVFDPSSSQQVDALELDDELEARIVRTVLGNLWQRRPFKWDLGKMMGEEPALWVEMIEEMRADVVTEMEKGDGKS